MHVYVVECKGECLCEVFSSAIKAASYVAVILYRLRPTIAAKLTHQISAECVLNGRWQTSDEVTVVRRLEVK